MDLTTATAPAPIRVWDEAKALSASVALTAVFTALYTALAPLVLLGALLGGPIWAALVLGLESARSSA